MQDHYETLQVHPKADQETIHAAYERLIQRYSSVTPDEAAEELVELAQQKRAAVQRAYAVLGDADRRAAYDAERQQQADQEAIAQRETAPADLRDEDRIDYRPLPPARGEERPKQFDPQPLLSAQEARQQATAAAQSSRLPPYTTLAITVAVVTFGVMLASLLLTGGGRPQYADPNRNANTGAPAAAGQQATDPQPTMTDDQLFAEYEAQVSTARQMANSLPDNPEVWRRLGDALYDSVQVVRERAPESERYAELVPRWLEASEAYARALELDPGNAAILSEVGVTLCYYGNATGEQDYVNQGLQHAHDAVSNTSENGRILMNLGICLVSLEPPQTAEALDLWQQVLAMPAAEVGVTRQAEILLQRYGQ